MKNHVTPFKRVCINLFFLCFVFAFISAQSKSLVVVDTEFPNKQQIISSISADQVLLELSSDDNPWKKIRENLELDPDLRTIHLFANTTYNTIRMGGINYDEDTVSNEFELSMLEGLYQGDNIQLLLYNCNLASNQDGLKLIDKIGDKAYFNVGACTSCTSVFDSSFTFNYSSLDKVISTNPITIN